MVQDSLPIILIPAYKPTLDLVVVVKNILEHVQGRINKIVIVDDGSGPTYLDVFKVLEVMPSVLVMHHAVNLGKGAALKTGLNYIGYYFPSCGGVVTADADGQHAVKDILNICEKMGKVSKSLILGSRKFDGDVPLRSKIGNTITRGVFAFFSGKKLTDTQTGLRGIPLGLLPHLLRVKSTGYDFELDMLMTAIALKYEIQEVFIQTIYENNNASSHFNPLLDSLKIYFVFIRFLFSSLTTFFIDFVVFSMALAGFDNILGAMALGRLFAGAFNFLFGKRVVFHSKGSYVWELFKYVCLIIVHMSVSYLSINGLVSYFNFPVIPIKLTVEAGLFFVSFAVQRVFVFSSIDDNKDGEGEL